MDKEINNNGYDYVDLDLPSRTLWATCNVGTSNPKESGLFFQWGDTKGYTKEQIGKDKWFNWDDSKWGEIFSLKKYTILDAKLELEDDAAHANMGGDWHIPTPEQCRELINHTTNKWIVEDGIYGMTFTSKRYPSNSIFIPAAGMAFDDSINDNDGIYSWGFIWSSMVNNFYASNGVSIEFNFHKIDISPIGDERCCGLNVRGVIG